MALVFPKYRDGRGYTSARLLRERFAFAGEIRAVGEVLREQAKRNKALHTIKMTKADLEAYKKYDKDPWQLFDLKADPKEERNVAAKHPDVVKQLSAKHAAWAKTLAPLGKIPKVAKPDGRIPAGHGWTFARGQGKTGGK